MWGADERRGPIDTVLWWLCLFVAPIALAGIELFHPARFTNEPGMWAYLSEAQPDTAGHHALAYSGPDWWFLLHMIQTPLVGLVAVGLWRMVAGIGASSGFAPALLAWLARIAVFIMLIYFTVLDAIGGIGLGRSIIELKALETSGAVTPDELKAFGDFLEAMWVDPWVGGVGSFVSLTASWTAFASASLVALALLTARRAPLLPLCLLVGFGWELEQAHAAPHGPLAFALLAASAAWIWARGDEDANWLY